MVLRSRIARPSNSVIHRGFRTTRAPRGPHIADVHRREAVRVLLHRDLLQDERLVALVRERELHQDAVDLRVRVQVAHRGEQLLRRRRVRQRDVD